MLGFSIGNALLALAEIWVRKCLYIYEFIKLKMIKYSNFYIVFEEPDPNSGSLSPSLAQFASLLHSTVILNKSIPSKKKSLLTITVMHADRTPRPPKLLKLIWPPKPGKGKFYVWFFYLNSLHRVIFSIEIEVKKCKIANFSFAPLYSFHKILSAIMCWEWPMRFCAKYV